MTSGIEDAEGRGAALEVNSVGARVGIRAVAPSGALSLICTPARARELAAALTFAADEADSARSAQPVTVKAGELRRGDVRDGDRAMTVDDIKVDGATVHVTWKSGAGRSWTQGYDTDADITLRRRAGSH
ncbi:hypothetical protein OG520_35315 [Streptomyces sp. NBC_00984]|uniref:hypothetical protein n=1 Tax=Streptomyces sp. NBC_00984 TaxID=2903700 RepID=UPI00386767D0|nr:hypothetical protein OG520_35315 [Streptomyces sp. NBC_00984]